jgi:hypothetical protein
VGLNDSCRFIVLIGVTASDGAYFVQGCNASFRRRRVIIFASPGGNLVVYILCCIKARWYYSFNRLRFVEFHIMHDGPGDKRPLPQDAPGIACYRCRRSKIKCQNNGVNTDCRACANQSRECTYSPPGAGQLESKRPESTGASRNDVEGREVKRARKRKSDATRKQSFRTSDDSLGSPPISPRLWKMCIPPSCCTARPSCRSFMGTSFIPVSANLLRNALRILGSFCSAC